MSNSSPAPRAIDILVIVAHGVAVATGGLLLVGGVEGRFAENNAQTAVIGFVLTLLAFVLFEAYWRCVIARRPPQ